MYPMWRRVIVRVLSLEECDQKIRDAVKSGLCMPDLHSNVILKKMAVDLGEIVSLGKYAFKEYPEDDKERPKPGTFVQFNVGAGRPFHLPTDMNTQYRVMDDDDIDCIIEESEINGFGKYLS